MSTDETREKLLEAAGPIFARKGFQSATVREICSSANVNLASVNYYFGDKERFYIETVKLAHVRRVEQAPQPSWPAGMPAEEKLHGFVLIMLERLLVSRGPSWETQLLTREIIEPTAACRELVRDYIRPQFEILLSILGELVPAETPLHRRHQLAFSVVGQCLYYRVADSVVECLVDEGQRDAHFTLPLLASHIAQTTLAGIAGMHHQPTTAAPGGLLSLEKMIAGTAQTVNKH